jgi:polyribonucleotide nucleotidyltransferase
VSTLDTEAITARQQDILRLTVAHAQQARRDIAALLAEVARLREALEPFAELLKKHQAGYVDAHPVYGIDYSVITVGDLRRARAALQAVEETP